MTILNKSILITLLNLAQTDRRASVQSIAVELGLTRSEAAGALNELSRQGLVRAATIRLTFVGLMRATGLHAQSVEMMVKSNAAA